MIILHVYLLPLTLKLLYCTGQQNDSLYKYISFKLSQMHKQVTTPHYNSGIVATLVWVPFDLTLSCTQARTLYIHTPPQGMCTVQLSSAVYFVNVSC